MQAYSRMLRLRLVWWSIWWGLCALGLASYLLQGVDALLYPDSYSNLSITIMLFWIFMFLWIVPSFIPKTERLLKKDLRKNPENLYAKALLLELKLKKKKKRDETRQKEEEQLRDKVKDMEEEVGEVEK